MEWTRGAGSFRDPSGFVFWVDDVLYRQVNVQFGPQYQQLIDSGLYAELQRDRLLIAHEEVELRLTGAPPAAAVLRPNLIPFINYPYEWCFSQYKAAALLTLEIQKRALNRGLVLRDASAFNVQFVGHRPVFIDTLSFGVYVEHRPWVAYRQFCAHFLAPIALMALVDPSFGQLSRVYIDGVPLDVAARLLGSKTWLRPGLFTHLRLHGAFSALGSPTSRAPHDVERRSMGKNAMFGLIDSLSRTVERITCPIKQTAWTTYVDETNYGAHASDHKQRLVSEWLSLIVSSLDVQLVWDLGANSGTFTRIASEMLPRAMVIAFDRDHSVVEQHVRHCSAQDAANILPLLQDLSNPSGGIGWINSERESLVERGPADVALALALIHHLAIGNNVPFRGIAEFLQKTCRYLIVEFVQKEDSQVQRMLAQREDVFDDYSQYAFEREFHAFFETIRKQAITETARVLYLMENRHHASRVSATHEEEAG